MVLLAGASIVIGQTSPTDEYDEWQKAEREAVREHREYLNNPKRSNYLDWRSAQRDAQRGAHFEIGEKAVPADRAAIARKDSAQIARQTQGREREGK